MNDLGTTRTILSLTTPGACIVKGQASRDMARRANEYAAKIRDDKPFRFGFFASLPSLLDTERAIEEIKYTFENHKPDGVIVFTRYGDENCYLGDPRLRPIWAELNARKAVVLVHPSTPQAFMSSMPPTLLLNITEFPHETTRAAVDLIFSNTKHDYPDIKFILSHAGGTLPYLMGRISLMELLPYAPIHKTRDEIISEAKTFYFDIALSGYSSTLRNLLEFAGEDHILFGSDFPYCPRPGLWRMNDGWEALDITQETRDKVNFKNAHVLFSMSNV
jgi:6-methylsalicylate decarboxylase